MKKLWIFPIFKLFSKFVLDAVSCGAQGRILLGRRKLRRPRGNSVFGAATYCAQDKFEKNLKIGKNPKIFYDASKNRNCTIKCILHSLTTLESSKVRLG